MSDDYDWLKGITLIDTGRVKPPKVKNPKGETLRIMANGEVYPGQELVNRYNLEYTDRNSSIGNGVDVIDSKDWGLDVFKDKPRTLLMGFTSKNNAKVDLFGQCRYNEDNTPKASVMIQGTTCEKLLTVVKELGWLSPEQKYCDLVLLTEYPITGENDIALIPKVVERGATKGDKTYQRRENEVFYPVVTIEEYNKVNGTTTNTVVEIEEADEPKTSIEVIKEKVDLGVELNVVEMANYISHTMPPTSTPSVIALTDDDEAPF